MTHLVLGSAGQVGRHLVDFLKKKGENVLEFDIVDGIDYDLRYDIYPNAEECIKAADFVYFLAFDVGGSKYLADYQHKFEFIDNNCRIMVNTFNLLKKYNKPFIFATSQMSNMDYSTYGLLKAIGERYTKTLRGINVKFWNVYGYEDDEAKAHVITDFVRMALKEGVIKMRTNGEEERQFLHGTDCARALFYIAKMHESIPSGYTIDLTSFEWVKIKHIADIIQAITQCKVIPGIAVDAVQKDKRNEPVKSELISFRYNFEISLVEGIRNIIEYEKKKLNG